MALAIIALVYFHHNRELDRFGCYDLPQGRMAALARLQGTAVMLLGGRLEGQAMGATTTVRLADEVIATLRAHEAELRDAGIRRLSLFGSVARGDAGPDSDVDLLAELDPAARIGLIGLVSLERRLGELLGCPVDLLPEPIEKARLRANIERDRQIAF